MGLYYSGEVAYGLWTTLTKPFFEVLEEYYVEKMKEHFPYEDEDDRERGIPSFLSINNLFPGVNVQVEYLESTGERYLLITHNKSSVHLEKDDLAPVDLVTPADDVEGMEVLNELAEAYEVSLSWFVRSSYR